MTASWTAFDAFVAENKARVAMPKDVNFPLNTANLDAWVERVAESEKNIHAWYTKAKKIGDVLEREAAVLALDQFTHARLARAFADRATHVPYVDFAAAVVAVAVEISGMCATATPRYTRVVLVLQDKALKSSTWVAQLMWPTIKACVTDVVGTVGEAVAIAADVGVRVLAIHPDDASYSGTQVAEAVADERTGLVARVQDGGGAKSLTYMLAIPYVSAVAKEKVYRDLRKQATAADWPRVKAAVVFPNDAGAGDRTRIMATIAAGGAHIVGDGEGIGFYDGLDVEQVPVYFDHKLADNVSAPTSIFAGAAYIERVEGKFRVRSLPLIDGCDEADPYRVHGRARVPGILVQDFDLGRTCPRAFYKTIGYTWNGRPIDPTKKLVPLLRVPVDASAGDNVRGLLGLGLGLVPRDAGMRARVADMGELSPAPGGPYATRTARFLHGAAQDFDQIFTHMGVALRQLATAPLDAERVPHLVWAHQRRFIDAYYSDSELQVEFLVEPPPTLWLLRDGGAGTRARSSYKNLIGGPIAISNTAGIVVAHVNAAPAHTAGEGRIELRAGWSAGISRETDRLDADSIVSMELYNVQADFTGRDTRDVPRVAAGIDVLVGSFERALHATPFLHGAQRAFTMEMVEAVRAGGVFKDMAAAAARAAAAPRTSEELTRMTVPVLKDLLRKAGANLTGRKDALVTRLLALESTPPSGGWITFSETSIPVSTEAAVVGGAHAAWNTRVEFIAGVHALTAVHTAMGYQHNALGGLEADAFTRGTTLGKYVDLTVNKRGRAEYVRVPSGFGEDKKAGAWPWFRTSPSATTEKYALADRIDGDPDLEDANDYERRNMECYGVREFAGAPMDLARVAVIDPALTPKDEVRSKAAYATLVDDAARKDPRRREVAADLYAVAARALVRAAHGTGILEGVGATADAAVAKSKIPAAAPHLVEVARIVAVAATLHDLMHGEWPNMRADGPLRASIGGALRSLAEPAGGEYATLRNRTFAAFRKANAGLVDMCAQLMHWDTAARTTEFGVRMFGDAVLGALGDDREVGAPTGAARAYFLDISGEPSRASEPSVPEEFLPPPGTPTPKATAGIPPMVQTIADSMMATAFADKYGMWRVKKRGTEDVIGGTLLTFYLSNLSLLRSDIYIIDENRRAIAQIIDAWRVEHPAAEGVDAGADLLTAPSTASPLNLAVKTNDDGILRAVLKGLRTGSGKYIPSAMLAQSEGGANALHVAIMFGSAAQASKLIESLTAAGQADLAKQMMQQKNTDGHSPYDWFEMYAVATEPSTHDDRFLADVNLSTVDEGRGTRIARAKMTMGEWRAKFWGPRFKDAMDKINMPMPEPAPEPAPEPEPEPEPAPEPEPEPAPEPEPEPEPEPDADADADMAELPEICQAIKRHTSFYIEDKSPYDVIDTIKAASDANSIVVVDYDNTLITTLNAMTEAGYNNAAEKMKAAVSGKKAMLLVGDTYGPANIAELDLLDGNVIIVTESGDAATRAVLERIGFTNVNIIRTGGETGVTKASVINSALSVRTANVVHFVDSSEDQRNDVVENVVTGANELITYDVSMREYVGRMETPMLTGVPVYAYDIPEPFSPKAALAALAQNSGAEDVYIIEFDHVIAEHESGFEIPATLADYTDDHGADTAAVDLLHPAAEDTPGVELIGELSVPGRRVNPRIYGPDNIHLLEALPGKAVYIVDPITSARNGGAEIDIQKILQSKGVRRANVVLQRRDETMAQTVERILKRSPADTAHLVVSEAQDLVVAEGANKIVMYVAHLGTYALNHTSAIYDVLQRI